MLIGDDGGIYLYGFNYTTDGNSNFWNIFNHLKVSSQQISFSIYIYVLKI